MPPPHTLQGLLQAAEDAAQAVELRTPAFAFKVRWATDYDGLFRGSNLVESDPTDLVVRALKTGRVLLQSAGGTGKTSILQRLRRDGMDQGLLPIYVDLRSWLPEMFEAWDQRRDSEPDRLQLLLDTLSSPAEIDDALIDLVGPERRVVLMVDGLNEVPAALGDSIISVVDSFARRHPRAGAIVTDRLVRRPISDSHWTLATIAPLDGQTGLAGVAFFRDLELAEGNSFTSSAAANRKFLTSHANLDEAELGQIGSAAFGLYGATRSRTFPLHLLEAQLDPNLIGRLQGAGLLNVNGDAASFTHHLFHDYLASIHMATDRSTWTPDGFDTITLTASSFDSVAMVLEQLPEPADADLFLRRIYDWNFYGAAYALATCRARNSAAVSEDMEIALLSMLAERRWDPFVATAQQVSDALALFPSGSADDFLNAPDLTSVFQLVNLLISDRSQLRSWADVFAHPVGAPLEDGDLTAIEDTDSLLGWTIANVIKRSSLTVRQLRRLVGILEHASDQTTRWRAAHALGAHPARVTIDGLFRALDDSYHWVGYGAVRSLIEIAARSAKHRADVLTKLRSTIQQRQSNATIARQLSRVLILAKPPDGWAEAVGPIIEDLWADAATEERQDHWRRVAYDLRRNQAERGNVA